VVLHSETMVEFTRNFGRTNHKEELHASKTLTAVLVPSLDPVPVCYHQGGWQLHTQVHSNADSKG